MRSRRALLSLITNIIREGVSILCGFIIPYVFISSFGTEVYGLTESVKGFLGFIVLLEAGFGPVVKVGLYKALACRDNEKVKRILKSAEKFFRRIAFVFLIYIVILSVVYPIISGSYFDYAFTTTLILVMSISAFAEYFFGMTYRLFLQSDQKSYIINTIQIVTLLLNLCFVVIAVKCGASIIVVEAITGLVYILRPILQKIYMKRKYDINLSNVDSNLVIKQKWDALAQHVALMIHSRADILILTTMATLKDVAVYSVYALVLNGIKSLVNTVADSFSAAFGDMIAKKESNTLRIKYGVYETMYLTITTIVYSCTIVLITPFIMVYTFGVNDANYIQPLFGVLLTISMYLFTVRQPYNELVKVAGHFRQTRRGAILEAIINIVLSIILVWQFGLAGVAAATLIATLIRTIEFICYTNKHILKRNILDNVKKIAVVILETLIIVIIAHFIPIMEMNSYLNWVIYAMEVLLLALVVVLPINYLLFRNDFKNSNKILKKVLKRK